jgi:DNA-binding HxlR family transcriptional regulator
MPTAKKPICRSECVFSNFLDMLGDKWTLLVIRDLLFFRKHEFKEFLASPEAIATNILSDRLKKLLAAGIVAERRHPDNRSRKLYYLTDKGKALLPILLEIAKWGSDYFPDLPRMQPVYKRLKKNPEALKIFVAKEIEKWERENLPH